MYGYISAMLDTCLTFDQGMMTSENAILEQPMRNRFSNDLGFYWLLELLGNQLCVMQFCRRISVNERMRGGSPRKSKSRLVILSHVRTIKVIYVDKSQSDFYCLTEIRFQVILINPYYISDDLITV